MYRRMSHHVYVEFHDRHIFHILAVSTHDRIARLLEAA